MRRDQRQENGTAPGKHDVVGIKADHKVARQRRDGGKAGLRTEIAHKEERKRRQNAQHPRCPVGHPRRQLGDRLDQLHADGKPKDAKQDRHGGTHQAVAHHTDHDRQHRRNQEHRHVRDLDLVGSAYEQIVDLVQDLQHVHRRCFLNICRKIKSHCKNLLVPSDSILMYIILPSPFFVNRIPYFFEFFPL